MRTTQQHELSPSICFGAHRPVEAVNWRELIRTNATHGRGCHIDRNLAYRGAWCLMGNRKATPFGQSSPQTTNELRLEESAAGFRNFVSMSYWEQDFLESKS